MTQSFPASLGLTVSRETENKLERFVRMLMEENQRQNLMSRSTVDTLWERHIVDSAQLLPLAPAAAQTWIDIGSGAGLPGVVLACLGRSVTLVEPRRRRCDFLEEVVRELQLSASVACTRAEAIDGHYDVITARAVAPLDALLAMTVHLSHSSTTWILPKGRNAKSELERARRNWHCAVREVSSVTSADSQILVIGKVKAKRTS